MRTRRALALLSSLMFWIPATPQANPSPPSEIPKLEQEIRTVTDRDSRGKCEDLVDLLGRFGFRILRQETLPLIRSHMRLLEPCILAAQRPPYTLEPRMQAEFRDYASAEGVAAMRSSLRARIVAHREAEIATRQLVLAVETLADYRDPEDVAFLTALLDTLGRAPADGLWSKYIEPPSWFVEMALRRFGDPDAGAVLIANPEAAGWHFARDASEISAAELYSYPALGLEWHPVALPRGEAAMIFMRLAAAPAAHPPKMFAEERAATLRLRFADGVAAEARAYSQGWIRYEDNRRLTDQGFYVLDSALASQILALTARVDTRGGRQSRR